MASVNAVLFTTSRNLLPCGVAEGQVLRWKVQRKAAVRHSGGRTMIRCPGIARAGEDSYDDPWDWGEDEKMKYGNVEASGKQSFELPRPPNKPNSPYGYLDFPPQHNLEIASLGLYIRNDVRRCLCVVSGGVYENLLFFPVIQLLRDRYPGVKVDIMTGERGKQVYELNKYIRKAYVYPVDDDWVVPAEYTSTLGSIRGVYYDMVLSTKVSGIGDLFFLFLMGARQRISYVPPQDNNFWSSRFLSQAIRTRKLNLADAGYHMYDQLQGYLGRPARDVPRTLVGPLEVGVGKRVRAVVVEKYKEVGVSAGNFVVFHGIESDSAASMQSKGDKDSLLPLQYWAQLKQSVSRSVVVVIPHAKEREKVVEACGDDVHVVFITTPGQLGALIKDSVAVVTTNTAALQLAMALKKPCVALFGSVEKAEAYIPDNEVKNVAVVSSKTGNLSDLDIGEALAAWKFLSREVELEPAM